MIIRNVTVINGAASTPHTGVDVLVTEGLFADIRPTGTGFPAAPGGLDGEPVIDGRGGYLIPGLWETHIHLSGLNRMDTDAEWWAYQRHMLAGMAPAGITSICDLGGPLAEARRLRTIAEADSSAPSQFFSGPCFTGLDGWPMHGGDQRHEKTELDGLDAVTALPVDSPEAALRHLRWLLDEVDYIKCIYDSRPGHGQQLSLPVLEAIVAAAHDGGKKVLVHVATGQDIREAVGAGADTIEHCFVPRDPADPREAQQIAELLAENATLYCPTVVTWEQIGRNGESGYLDELVADGMVAPGQVAEIAARPIWGQPLVHQPADVMKLRFEYAMRTLHLFHEAGVKLVTGSDLALALPTSAHALLRELQLFAKAGIPCADIITAATAHAAEKIGKQDSMGTVAVGSAADAVLLDADPRTGINHLLDPKHRRAVIKSGRLVHQ